MSSFFIAISFFHAITISCFRIAHRERPHRYTAHYKRGVRMDIEGRSLLVDDSEENQEALNKALKKVLKSVFGKANLDAKGDVIKIDKIRIEPGKNGIGKLNCVTLTGVDIDREVLVEIEDRLKALLEAEFFVIANGASKLDIRPDYQERRSRASPQ